MLRRILICLLACAGLMAIAPVSGAQAATGRIYTCAGNNDPTLVDMGAPGWAWMGGNSGRDCMGEGTRFFPYNEPQRAHVQAGWCMRIAVNGGALGPVIYGDKWVAINASPGLTGTWATMIYNWDC